MSHLVSNLVIVLTSSWMTRSATILSLVCDNEDSTLRRLFTNEAISIRTTLLCVRPIDAKLGTLPIREPLNGFRGSSPKGRVFMLSLAWYGVILA